ncbi:MAG: tRNA lysidine(34) synthetase TilS [Paramuribaculum sp.]|nr:tRNA lysidine(34) synthetase TilS [Paramuribaculum sp.]
MGAFRDKVERYIIRHNLIDKDAGLILVALSGGADSVALLAVLVELGYKCKALHCNFHLRGAESERDASHAQDISAQLGVPVSVKDFDVERFRQMTGDSISIEMACRDLRYNWFAEMLETEDAQAVAVAHSIDDNIETLMLNLMRGTGIMGIKGMVAKNNNRIIRPLLCVTRPEIESYLREKSLDYIVDSTNLQNIYRRNSLRNKVLPNLYSAFPQAKSGITASLVHLSENAALYDLLVKEKLEYYSVADGGIDIKKLIDKELHSHLLLYEWLRPKGASRSITDDIIRCVNNSGRRFDIGKLSYVLDRGILMPIKGNFNRCVLENFFDIKVYPVEKFKVTRDPNKAYFDVSVLDGDNLWVRYWMSGDKMRPFGVKGHKKLSDIFNDAKVGVDKKPHIPLLMKGDEILWVAGIRQSESYRINTSTKQYVEIFFSQG